MDFRIPKVCTRPMAERYCVTAIAKLIRQFVFFLEGKFHCCTWFSNIFFLPALLFFPSDCLGDHILCLDLRRIIQNASTRLVICVHGICKWTTTNCLKLSIGNMYFDFIQNRQNDEKNYWKLFFDLLTAIFYIIWNGNRRYSYCLQISSQKNILAFKRKFERESNKEFHWKEVCVVTLGL